jgi:predicted RNA-binding Zn ribbon-like protein
LLAADRYQDPRPPAPPRYRILQALVNTTNSFWWRDEVDDLSSPEGVARWLRAAGATEQSTKASPRDLRMLRDFREGLRALMRAHAGVPLRADVLVAWNALLRQARLRLQYDRRGRPWVASPGHGVQRVVERMTNLIIEATVSGEWERFKACRRCGWAFYDQSRNRHGRWCQMAVCGNHVKARAFRARRRKQLPAQA